MKPIARLSALACWCIVTWVHAAEVVPGHVLQFPRDFGSHPEFRLEWWYVTGNVQDEHGAPQGFQLTFFRVRNEAADPNPSAFAPKQLLFAHAALSLPTRGSLLHAERSARAGFGIAEAKIGVTDVTLDDWSLKTVGATLQARVKADDFALSLTLTPTQPPLLEGDRGYSRKSPEPRAASYYYSLPQVRVSGTFNVQGRDMRVNGTAWFDHEWSTSYLDPESRGWDWLGLNLANGDALMIFRMRDARGKQRWASSTWRSHGSERTFDAEAIVWTPLRQWRSPRTGVDYPIAWRVRVGESELWVRPLMDDQESDARGSTGTLYYEGAVEVTDATGALLGRGYLELTGYGERLKL